VLYMATGKQTHLVSKFVHSKVVLFVWVVWSYFHYKSMMHGTTNIKHRVYHRKVMFGSPL